MYSRTKPTTYIVWWPTENIVKAGFSERQRWRTFLLNGATLVDLVEADDFADAYALESVVLSVFGKAGVPAFDSAAVAKPFLGGHGGGHAECYRLPHGVHPLTVLAEADWSAA